MSNPFDQFDQAPAANPFDQFDAPKAAAVAPAPVNPGLAMALGGDPTMMSYSPQTSGYDTRKAVDAPDQLLAVGAPAVGMAAGAAYGGIPGAVAGGMAGNALSQGFNNLTGTQQGFRPGEMAASGVMGLVPGGATADSTAWQIARQAGKLAATNVAAKTTETLIDQKRLPTKGEVATAAATGAVAAPLGAALDSGANSASVSSAAKLDATRAASIKAIKEAGWDLPPAETSSVPAANLPPGTVATKLTKWADPKAVTVDTIKSNQPVTNAKAATAIGLDPAHAISEEAIDNRLTEEAAPFQAVADSSPQGKDLLEQWQTIKDDARASWNEYKGPARPKAALREAQALDDKADGVLDQLTKVAAQTDPNLVPAMLQAQKNMAMIHQVEMNTNLDTGEVNALGFAKALKKGVPLTDELAQIGHAAKTYPQYFRPASTVVAPEIAKSSGMKTAGGAAIGHLIGGTPGAVIGGGLGMAQNATRGVARSLLLSDAMQNGFLSRFAQPNYGTPSPDLLANLAKFGTMQAGQQPTPDQINSLMQAIPSQ